MDDCTEPIVQDDLYELIVTAKIEDALYLTGVMIIDERFQELEDTWIRACAGNELKGKTPSSWKWKDVISDTYKIVKSDAFDITDAMVLTTKMCIFYKELLVDDVSKKPMVHIKHLRNVILEDFPDGATLSAAGIKRYKRLLPVDQEELVFAHRILSGISRIWTERQHEKSRDALEYLSRRRLSIQLPDRSWPSPAPENANEFIWFLWGAVLCYFQHVEAVHKMFFLFKNGTKKNKRQHRLGLLWHAGYILGNVEGAMWTIDENKWLTYVRDNTEDIWEQIRNTQKELKETERALKKASGHGSPADDFDEIFGYIPRTTDKLHIPAADQKYYPSHAYKPIGDYDSSTRPDAEGGAERRIKIVGVRASRDPQTPLPFVKKVE